MPCDICSGSGATTSVETKHMRRAVRKGFNPFRLGLIPPSLARLATPDYPAKWDRQASTGILSHTDWSICETCLPTLKRYLPAAS